MRNPQLRGTHTPLVAVNVALRIGNDVTAAAVADPFSAEVLWTDGKTAHVRSDGQDHPVAPDATSHLVDVNLDPPFPNQDRFRTARMLNDEAFTGRHAAYITDGDLRDSVHFSAGIALCQAAGCVATGLAGQPLHTGAQGLIAAADTETHAALADIISKQAPRLG